MDEESLSNLSFLNDSHVDAGELASDDKSGSDDGGATDEEDINVTLARALAEVTPGVKRVDTGATDFLQKPLDMYVYRHDTKSSTWSGGAVRGFGSPEPREKTR